MEIALECWKAGKWADISAADQPHEAGLLQLDIKKAGKVLHWFPKLKSREAIEWTIDWYKQSPENKFAFTLQQIKSYQDK